MRGSEFLDKMKLVDPAYVETADVRTGGKKISLIKTGGIAACLALAVFAGIRVFPQGDPGLSPEPQIFRSEPEQTPELPMLSISENNASAMGYEGYLAYDISELVSANPWNEDLEISTLPVYRNPLTYDENFIASGADFDRMRMFITEVAGRLGLDESGLIIMDDAPDEESRQKTIEKFRSAGAAVPEGYFNPTKLIVEADGLKIEVDQSMTAKVLFDPAVSLPEEYNFTHFASYDDTAAAADYLKNEYDEFIGMNHPQINLCGGDYTYDGQQTYSIEFFNADGNEMEQLINYNFNRVTFGCDDEGKLFIARIYRPDLSSEMGEYPIIRPEQAKELLLNGNYITTVPCEMPGAEFVRKTELVYRTGQLEKYFMPYYRFYVELPEEEQKNGLKTYGAYYVPAVESSYISNMPAWDGSFNL